MNQTAKVLDRINGKSVLCPHAETGIEGLIYKQNGDIIPFSLKRLNGTDSPYNVVGKIINNKDAIIKAINDNNEFGGFVKTGSNPNTILDVEIKLITKESMIKYLNENPNKLNFTPSTFSEFYFECKDGEIL